jgi:hypothetical protein
MAGIFSILSGNRESPGLLSRHFVLDFLAVFIVFLAPYLLSFNIFLEWPLMLDEGADKRKKGLGVNLDPI